MFTPIQIEIIKAFGSKQLSEGCLIQIKWEYYFTIIDIEWDVATCYHPLKCTKDKKRSIIDIEISKLDWNRNKILWNIPELFPDVARVAKEKWYEMTVSSDWWISIRTHEDDERESIKFNPTLPLINQEESTLVQLLNLFK